MGGGQGPGAGTGIEGGGAGVGIGVGTGTEGGRDLRIRKADIGLDPEARTGLELRRRRKMESKCFGEEEMRHHILPIFISFKTKSFQKEICCYYVSFCNM